MMNACPRWSFLAVPLLAALGCSDPVPPPAQGAVTLDLSQPTPTVSAMSCPITKLYQVGAKDPNTMAVLAPTMQSPGESVISGESGSTISCSVTGGGGNFSFSGSLHASTPQGDQILVSFQNGMISGTTGTADVNVYTPQLSANFSGTGCTITVQNNQVKGGSIWATFACPQIAYPPSGLCGISPDSTIVFENCVGS
ncbi:MAG TPA: hypothetical protein VK745_02995 [Polyangiaceae bacterium]|jgi:hypothetical protein|nr:hypothetical protein [Polyangiaceae bacterium]